VSAVFLALWLPTGPQAKAAEVWNGSFITFTEPVGGNPTLPVNQDRITANVWITRGSTMGIYNVKRENFFTRFLSPAGTEWAYGSLDNYSSLTYHNWETWNGKDPPGMIGRSAVMHLITDDIYLGVNFLSWGGNGGGFSYERSTPVPEPSAAALAAAGLGVAAGLYKRAARHRRSSN
jgi:hypothetical protein